MRRPLRLTFPPGRSSSSRSASARDSYSAISSLQRRNYRRQVTASRPVCHPLAQLDSLLDCPQGAPQRVLQLVVLETRKAFLGKTVPDMTPVAHEIAVLELPQRASTIGAGEWRGGGPGNAPVSKASEPGASGLGICGFFRGAKVFRKIGNNRTDCGQSTRRCANNDDVGHERCSRIMTP